MYRRQLFALWLLLIMSCVKLEAGVTVAEVREAWRDRGKRYPHGIVQWTEERLVPAGSKIKKSTAGEYPGANPYGPTPPSGLPREEKVHTFERRWAFKNDELVRYTWSGPVLDMTRQAFVDAEMDLAFDGEIGRSWTHQPDRDLISDRGAVFGGRRGAGVARSWAELIPVAAFFRPPLGTGGPFYWSELVPLSDIAEVNGRACFGFRRPDDSRRVYVTTEGSHLLARFERRDADALVESLEIDYDEDTTLPVSWVETSWARDGSLKRKAIAHVEDIDLVTSLPEDHFVIKFPVHTLVTDHTGSAGAERYIVQENNRRTNVDSNTLMRGSEEKYIAARDGEQRGVVRGPRKWLTIGGVFLVFLIMVLCGVRIKRWQNGQANVQNGKELQQ